MHSSQDFSRVFNWFWKIFSFSSFVIVSFTVYIVTISTCHQITASWSQLRAEGYQGMGGDVRGDLITCSIEHPHPNTGLPVPTVCTSVQQPHPQCDVWIVGCAVSWSLIGQYSHSAPLIGCCWHQWWLTHVTPRGLCWGCVALVTSYLGPGGSKRNSQSRRSYEYCSNILHLTC